MLTHKNAYNNISLFSKVACCIFALTLHHTPCLLTIAMHHLYPMQGVAHNAVESISVAGEDVLVLGCGPVGLFAIAIAKVLGK